MEKVQLVQWVDTMESINNLVGLNQSVNVGDEKTELVSVAPSGEYGRIYIIYGIEYLAEKLGLEIKKRKSTWEGYEEWYFTHGTTEWIQRVVDRSRYGYGY